MEKGVFQQIHFTDLGSKGYKEVWDLQEQLLVRMTDSKRRVAAGGQEHAPVHHLLFVEHPPVFTLGKSGKEEHVLISPEERERLGVSFYKTNRGGDITFHGPGQIVGYPILDLEQFYTDIGRYLRNLEEVIIRTLAFYGITGERSTGETGVWIEPGTKGRERKICAMGVRCSRWVTMHGFAFNVNTDLNYFDQIVPCGISDRPVGRLADWIPGLSCEQVRPLLLDAVAARFGLRWSSWQIGRAHV